MESYQYMNTAEGLTSRPCNREDRDFVLGIYERTLFRNLRDYFEPDLTMFDERFYEDCHQKSLLLLHGEAIGMYQPVPETDALYIKGLFLQPEYHRRGYGGFLMDYFEKIALDRSLPKIRLHVWDNNPAKGFYEHRGYGSIGLENHKHLLEKKLYCLTDRKENRLVALHRLPEEGIMDLFPALSHSLVVGVQGDRVLFVYNNWKKEWELAGGVREEESPRECAIREMYEETGKSPVDLTFHSVMEWRLGREQRREYGALYTCRVEGKAEILNTEEIGETRFWDLREDIGDVAELDRTLSLAVLKGWDI